MRVLVFQHVDCEHPGSLRQFLSEDGIEWDPVYLHRGDQIPSCYKCMRIQEMCVRCSQMCSGKNNTHSGKK